MTTAEIAVLVTLIVYKVVLIGFGLIAERRVKDRADYYLGGRALGPVVASVSASASSSSAWTLLGVSGAAYAWGLSALWLFPACVGGFALNWYLLAPALHRLSHRGGALTATEVLATGRSQRARRTLSVLASLIIVLSLGTYVASQFQGAGKTFHETFGLSTTSSVLIGSGVVVLYTMLGGFWAVSLTDTLQGLMMAAASVLLPVVALSAVGGPGQLIEGMAAVEAEGYTSLLRGMPAATGLGFVAGLLGIGLGYPGQPHVVNRFMALRNDARDVAIARRVAMGWAVVVYAGMIILGWCGRVLYAELGDREVVMITITNELLPPVVAGVVLAAILSAVMSTADSQLLVVASTVTHDLGWGKSDSTRHARVVTVAISAFAVVLALMGSQEIFSRVLFAWAAMGCAFGPLLLVTALSGPVASRWAVAAMAAGFVLSVLAYSFPETKGGLFERVVPFAVALALAWFGRRRAIADPSRV